MENFKPKTIVELEYERLKREMIEAINAAKLGTDSEQIMLIYTTKRRDPDHEPDLVMLSRSSTYFVVRCSQALGQKALERELGIDNNVFGEPEKN